MSIHPSSRVLRLCCLFGLILLGLSFSQACENKPKDECFENSDCEKGFFCSKATKQCKKLACQGDADCEKGQLCQSGACIQGSGTETAPVDAAPTDTVATDTAPTDQVATETAGDQPSADQPPTGPCKGQPTCQADAECQNGAKCKGGCCLPGCVETKDCPSGFQCKTDSQQCVQCLQDSDCPVLGDKCNADGTCGAQTQCPGGKPPGPDGKCEGTCTDAKCAPTETPDPSDNCKCIAKINACEVCTKDAECGIGNKCVEDTKKNKFCAIDCTADGKCDAGYTCLSLGDYSVCMPSSGYCPCLGVQCDPNKVCCKNRGACFECCGDADCKTAGHICRADGSCGSSDPCKGVTCAAGQQCNSTNGMCDCASPCPSGTCCGAGDTACTAAACTPQGGGTCSPACASGQQCCKSPLPGLPDQCLAQCQGGAGGGCKTDSDCMSGEICCKSFGNMCLPNSNPLIALLCGGSSGSGTDCQSDASCKAGQTCAGGLPPLLPGKCTCGTDADCNAGTCQGGQCK